MPRIHLSTIQLLLLVLLLAPNLFAQSQPPFPGPDLGLSMGYSENLIQSSPPKSARILAREIVQVGRDTAKFRVVRYLLSIPTGKLRIEFYGGKLQHARYHPTSPQETSAWIQTLGKASRTTATSMYWIRGHQVWRAARDGQMFESGTLEFLEKNGALSPLESIRLRELFGENFSVPPTPTKPESPPQ
ncbi:MAG: hypothetical protein QF752_10350 [Planctomycetota bacterium]|jgi:hypothetical protein|nr:hypothetical protein [Planctomycetota bacterium]